MEKQQNGKHTQTDTISVDVLTGEDLIALARLENCYLAEIGEEPMDEAQQQRLLRAIRDGKILFFGAKYRGDLIGMCSVTCAFSTFACTQVGTLEDFFVQPEFRGNGAARKLIHAAQVWCAQNEIASLTVCCAPCDEAMYQALGFEIPLGNTFAYLP